MGQRESGDFFCLFLLFWEWGGITKSEIKVIVGKVFSRSQNIRIIVETIIEVVFSMLVVCLFVF